MSLLSPHIPAQLLASSFAIEAPYGDTGSLAYVGASLVRALDEEGHAPIAVPNPGFDPRTAPPAVLRAVARHRILRRQRGLTVDRSLRYGLHHNGDTIRARSRAALLYWDSDYMPPEFTHHLSGFDELYGISSFVAEVIRNATGRPAGVLNHGVWLEACPYVAPPADGPFTFLHLGQVDARKATDLLLLAFVAAFGPDRDVRLVVKCGPSQLATAKKWHVDHGRFDRRIEIVGDHVDRATLSSHFHGAHAVVLPSRCEGFGLVGLEALAHGRFLIAHAFSGPLDYLDPMDCALVPSCGSIPAPLYPGLAREPDFEALVSALRDAAANREAVERRGMAARLRVLPSWTWRERVRGWVNRDACRVPQPIVGAITQ